MTTALKVLSQIANELFERHMLRAASRIGAKQHLFPHHAA